MSDKLFKIIGYFLVMPTFWGGLVATYLSYRSRVKSQRQTMNTPIDRRFYEWREFFVWGIVPGLFISALSFGLGVPLTAQWILIYLVLTTLSLLLFGYRLIHPLYTFTVTTLASWGLTTLIESGRVHPETWPSSAYFLDYVTPVAQTKGLARNVLILLTLALLMTLFTFMIHREPHVNPRFLKSPRGKWVARYRLKNLWLVPLLLIVPGDVFGKLAPWWPLLNLGGKTFTPLLVPILFGFRYTTQTQSPRQAQHGLLQDFKYLTGLAILFSIGAYFKPSWALPLLGVLLIGGVWAMWHHRQRERQWRYLFGPGESGLRVVGVRPNSPAARMGIEVGDELLEGQGKSLSTLSVYYEMLTANRAYVKLRVRRIDGELILVETPVYEEDPYDLGIVLLEDRQL